ncbi:hypothetical protein JD543_04905 [Aeromonas caviae]|uniref:hypothetical protein n=1 Tax=Aeromonas caviae TaxID=648 RepID=UPI00191D9174|nr:hypothetical protein [Aeromonas caviae]MBL0436803.1 hypothetical protein [Aeromonas caviae]
MSVLKSMIQQNAKPAATTKNGLDMVGISLMVEKAIIIPGAEGDALELVGTPTNSTSAFKEGERLRVQFRPDLMQKAIDNLIKGTGQGAKPMLAKLKSDETALAGSLVALEHCYPVKVEGAKATDTDGNQLMMSRWLTTVSSNFKMHDDRLMLDGVFASAPKIRFDNPKAGQPDEPKAITFAVNANADDKIWVQIPTANGAGNVSRTQTLDWVKERLQAAKQESKRISVYLDTLSSNPQECAPISSEAELKTVLANQLAQGTTALSMLRLTDDTGAEVLTRKVSVIFKQVDGQYEPDTEQTIQTLLDRPIFKDLANEQVFAGLSSGVLKMEAIPGYRVSFSGNPLEDNNISNKTINQVLEGKTTNFNVTWGNNGENYSRVLLPGIARNDSISGFTATGFLQEEMGTYTAKTLPTPLIGQVAPESQVTFEEEPEPLPPVSDHGQELEHEAEHSGPRP